jgi:NADPH:quinone reductase-like Zn-dependent oxidoreductase
VTRFRTGARVAGIFFQDWIAGTMMPDYASSALGGARDGMLSEYVVLDQQVMVSIPKHLSFEQGATLPCAAVTAWNALTSASISPGQTVLVLGTGGVSIFALQLARIAGARVIVTSKSDEKLERARKMGASAGINYTRHTAWGDKVLEITGGGVDHVIEVGGPGTIARSFNAVRVGGRISVIGMLAGVNHEINPLTILAKQLTVQGVFVGSREHFETMNQAIAFHGLEPVVDRVFGFDEVHAAMKWMAAGAHFGKVVIRLT